MITTNNESIYNKLKLLRNYGSPEKYKHRIKGKNARLDTLHAAVLIVKLKYLDEWNKRRNEVAGLYSKGLKEVGDLVFLTVENDNYSCYHIYPLRTKKRDDLFNYLNSKGIQCVIHYPIPIHLQEAYNELGLREGSFPIAEKLAREILSIPMHPEITDDEVSYVIDMIKAFYIK